MGHSRINSWSWAVLLGFACTLIYIDIRTTAAEFSASASELGELGGNLTLFSQLLDAPSRTTRQLRFPDDFRRGSGSGSVTIRTYDSVVVESAANANTNHKIYGASIDGSETAELRRLEADIQLLDEELQAQMRHKKPSVSQNFHLLPKPNFGFLPDLSPLRQLFQWNGETVRSHTTCYACKLGIGLFLTKARLKTTLEDVMEQAVFACTFFQLSSKEVCSGLVSRFAPTLYFIGTSKSDLTPLTFCAMALQSSGCVTKDPLIYWSVLGAELFGNHWRSAEVDGSGRSLTPASAPAPPPQSPSSGGFRFPRTAQSPATSRKVYFHEAEVPLHANPTKILHLTDIHLDLEYEPGADANCPHALCCRKDDGIPEKSANRAGYYGDYRGCDLPIHSLENALQHISRTHPVSKRIDFEDDSKSSIMRKFMDFMKFYHVLQDIALIYMTGDLVSHEIWRTNIERNREVIQASTAMIRKYFPHTTLIPVLGNHETHPVNLYSTFGAPHPLGTDWVYEETARAWEGWIPKHSLPNFLRAGYFDVQVAPNLRVVVLNTNLCYTLNFWQIYDGRDPGGQLEWLVSILTKSESRGEKVHILGHVPPNQNECWFVWSKNFYQIINRFSSTVKAQFYGHTHYDGFHLYYDEKNKMLPISSIWIGASLTPFTNLNPGYKIFSVDGERGAQSTWAVIDHETWIYNLTAANLGGPYIPPNWYRLYRATEAYDLPNMLPESLDVLVHRMATDEKFFYAYHRNFHKAAEIALSSEDCDTMCRKRFLCNIVTPYFSHTETCERIEEEVDGIVYPRTRL